MSKTLLGIIGLIVAVAAGVWIGTTYINSSENDSAAQATPTPTPTVSETDHSAHTVTYQGEDGKTALVLLMEKYPNSTVSGEGEMAFVTSINGHAADTSKNEFWKLQVNGTDAQVGAGSLQTTSGDTIVWVIDTY